MLKAIVSFASTVFLDVGYAHQKQLASTVFQETISMQGILAVAVKLLLKDA